MVERRKGRKRKDEISSIDGKIPQDKPSKEEYAVAKWIRNNVPSKKTKFDRNHNVEYFTGTRAVDALLENSPWSKTRFENREQVKKFLDMMLRHKFFHRAKKVVISEEELCKIRGIKKKLREPKEDKKSSDKEKEKEKEDSKESKDIINKDNEEKSDERKETKKKPKVRLEMHMDQYFVDCNDAYVWIYEPIPVYYWFFGTLVVLGAIGVCLFPLWPQTIRNGVYYSSIAAAGLLICFILLSIIRVIVFCLLWIPTLGRCHLWLFPNLIADVGILASFWPLYQYEYYGVSNENDKRSSKKKKKKEKDSDTEETPSTYTEERSNAEEPPKDETSRIEEIPNGDNKKDSVGELAEGSEGSEEGSESEKSNTDRDFVMV